MREEDKLIFGGIITVISCIIFTIISTILIEKKLPTKKAKLLSYLGIFLLGIISNNISIKENGVSGGKRKTKKNRKQNGGFTYKISSKRTGITSKSSRRSTRNSSRRSSR